MGLQVDAILFCMWHKYHLVIVKVRYIKYDMKFVFGKEIVEEQVVDSRFVGYSDEDFLLVEEKMIIGAEKTHRLSDKEQTYLGVICEMLETIVVAVEQRTTTLNRESASTKCLI